METEKEMEQDFQPVCIVYKDGTVQRFEDSEGVSSRDVTVSEESDVTARLFLPRIKSGRKFPVVVYLHGGLYVGGSPCNSLYHAYMIQVVPPEVALSTSIKDVWSALKWVASEATGGSDPWLTKYGDSEKLILMGDCSGSFQSPISAVQLVFNRVNVMRLHPKRKIYLFSISTVASP